MVWEGLAVKLAALAAGVILVVLLVRSYVRSRAKQATAQAENKVRREGAEVRDVVDTILSEPVLKGSKLRARLFRWAGVPDRDSSAPPPAVPGPD
jgi:hypothetical protein